MSGPVLGLGITATGIEQVKQLADAVSLLDRNLASIQSRGGSTGGTASLGGLDQLLAEVQRIRQGVGEAAAGLRTEMADLKQTVTNSINGSLSAVGKAAETASKQAGDQVESSLDSFKAKLMVGSEKIVAAQAQAAAKEEASTDAFIFRSNKSLASFLKQRQTASEAVEKSGVDSYTAKLMVGSEKVASAQSLAAQREEEANNNFIFRANKSLQAFLQQRQDEAAQVQRSAQAVEAAYAASSKASQLRSQLGARAQLDQGIPTADVTAKFGSTATLAAQAKDAASLRKEIEAAAHSMDGFSLATSGAKRELLVIFGEVVRGNYTRLASSIDVLIRQSGATNYVFSLTALAIAASAAAAIAAAAAYAKGTFELHEFEKQATLTGGAVGLSASQFTQVRDSLEGIGVTKGKAAEALTAIAASGLIAGTNVKSIADAAIQLERAAGIPIEKTIKNFEDLARRPAEASAKLNETYHYLTATVYEQILALEKHGKTQEAADLAEKTYADSMTQRAQKIIDGQGYIEKGWHGIANAAKGAWDAMLDLGREDSMVNKLNKAVEAMETAQRRLALAKGKFQDTASGAAIGVRGVVSSSRAQSDLDAAQGSVSSAFRRAQIEDSNAASGVFNAKATESAAEFSRRTEQYASRQDRMQREIDQVVASGKAGLKPQSQIDAAVAAIRANFERGNGESASGILGRGDTARLQIQRYKELSDKNDYDTDPHLTQAEAQLATIRQKLAVTTDGLKRAELERAASAAQNSIQVERDEKAARKHYDAVKADYEQVIKFAQANDTSAESIRQKAAQVEQENANFGKNKTAIEQANLALMKNQLLEADSSDSFDPKYVASLRNKTDAQADYVKQLQLAEAHQEQKKLDEDLRVAQEQAKTVAQEYELLGLSAQERDRILAQRKAELELAKQIADIDKLNLGDGPEAATAREAMKGKARETARLKATNDTNQKIYEQWRKTSDDISKSLTDALLSGFERGKNAATQFRDALKKMFSELVLRPVIQAIMAPVSGQLTQMAGSLLNGSGGSGGIGNLLSSSGGSTWSLSNVGTSGQGIGGYLGFGASAAGGSNAMAALTSSNAAAAGGGASGMAELAGNAASNTVGAAASSYLPYVGAAMAVANKQYGQAAGMAIGTAIMPGIGTVIGAVIGSIVDSFSKSHGPKTESGYGTGVPLRGNATGATQLGQAIQQQYSQVAGALGVSNTKLSNLGVFYAQDPNGTAKTQLQIAGGGYNRGSMLGGIENVGRTDQEFKDAISNATAQLIVKNLQAALGGKIGAYVRGLDVASITATSAEFTRLQTIATQRTSLQQRLDQMTANATTAENRLAKARADEAAATDDLNQDLLQRVYAQEDLVKAGQDLAAAYSAQESAMNSSTNSLKSQITTLQDYAKSLRGWVNNALTGDASPLGAMQKLQQAARDFDNTLALAHGGDTDARGALTGKAGAYLANLKDSSATAVDYAMGFSKVTSALTLEAASADSQATVLQQQLDVQQAQLDAAKAQLQQLGLLNVNVMSWADAWAAYQNAKTKVDTLSAAAAAEQAAATAPSGAGGGVLSAITSAAKIAAGGLNTGQILDYFTGTGAQGWDGGAFADGGYHSGGIRLVGERGPELEYTGPSYIQDAMTTQRVLNGGGGGNDDTLVQEVRLLRAAIEANTGFTYQIAKDQREMKQRGFPVRNSDDGTKLSTSTT